MRGGDVNTTSGHAYRQVRPAAWLLVIAVVIGISAKGFAQSSATQAEPCVAAATVSSAPHTGGAAVPPVETARATDPVGPFPLSALLPFPWASIDGIWTMKLPDGTSLYFSFEVQSDCNGRKILKVNTFDRTTYRLTGDGTGLALANDTMVRAAITTPSTQYMLYIRQFKQVVGKGQSRQVTVVTVRPFNGNETDDIHMVARKVSVLTLDQYVKHQQELARSRQIR